MTERLIGIQGGMGSYHEIMTRQMYGDDRPIAYIPNFPELFAALRSGAIGSAVAAKANNRKGPISETSTALMTGEFAIIGEGYLSVKHQLLGIPGAVLEDVREVHSQDHALEQCGDFLHGSELTAGYLRIEQDDTAESARLVSEWQDPSKAAIASLDAGLAHGLAVIRSDVQDDPDNLTRFLHLEKMNGQNPSPDDDKSSIILTTGQTPGSLVEALIPFRDEGVNVANLHSTYIPNSPFDMRFLLEFEAGALDCRTDRIINRLGDIGCEVVLLGSYKKAEIPGFADKLGHEDE